MGLFARVPMSGLCQGKWFGTPYLCGQPRQKCHTAHFEVLRHNISVGD